MANYDLLGNIAIVKFPLEMGKEEKLNKAKEILSAHKGVRTVLEKIGKIKGRLRTAKLKHILGEKNLIAECVESGCRFKFNVEECYFSLRMACDRISCSEEAIRIKARNVLVMFSGIGPYPIILAKLAKSERITAIELGKSCCEYAWKNAVINKVENKIKFMQGDVKKVIPSLKKEKFDFIVMARPNLKSSFLDSALKVSRKGTEIWYHGFCPEEDKDKMVSELIEEAQKNKRRIKILNVKEIGDIAPYEHRYRILIKVLN